MQTRLLNKLGPGCYSDWAHVNGISNVAESHSLVDGQLTQLPRDTNTLGAAAGSIECSADGLSRWLLLQLAGGRTAAGSVLFSERQSKEMWTPQSIIPELWPPAEKTGTHFRSYGLGWFLEDFHGTKRVWHTGGSPGAVSYVSIIPEKNLGVAVLLNQHSGAAMSTVMLSLLDAYLGVPPSDWASYFVEFDRTRANKTAAPHQHASAAPEAGHRPPAPLSSYAGTYRDAWRGDVKIELVAGRLRITFSRTTGLQGDLSPLSGDIFVAHWDDRSLDADALVHFRTDFDGTVTGMTMNAQFASTDFSYDFQDLDFVKLADASGAVADQGQTQH